MRHDEPNFVLSDRLSDEFGLDAHNVHACTV